MLMQYTVSLSKHCQQGQKIITRILQRTKILHIASKGQAFLARKRIARTICRTIRLFSAILDTRALLTSTSILDAGFLIQDFITSAD